MQQIKQLLVLFIQMTKDLLVFLDKIQQVVDFPFSTACGCPAQLSRCLLKGKSNQVIFVLEVLVKRGPADLRSLTDVVDCYPGEALLFQELENGSTQRLPGFMDPGIRFGTSLQVHFASCTHFRTFSPLCKLICACLIRIIIEYKYPPGGDCREGMALLESELISPKVKEMTVMKKLFGKNEEKKTTFSIDSKLGDLMKDPQAAAILEESLPGISKNPQLKMGFGMSLKFIAGLPQAEIPREKLAEIDAKLKTIEQNTAAPAETPLRKGIAPVDNPNRNSQKRLEGKVVILTGVSAGLGKQLAVVLAREGARLAICARRVEKLMETAGLCEKEGAEVLALTCDVSKYDDLKNLVDKTVERFGTVDVLINNANFEADRMPFMDQTIDMLDTALHTGVYAHWHLMQLCHPYLKGKSSSIINFTSGMYQVGLELYGSYAADKGAIRALSMVVAREWGLDGIRVNTISPVAITDTILHKLAPEYSEWVKDMMSHNSMGRVGDPATDIGPVVVFLACDDSRWITGQNINVDGGQPETIHV